MRRVVNAHKIALDFDIAVMHMDDEIREYLHEKIAPCSDQEFFTAYCEKHYEKYGKEFFLNTEYPVY